MDSRREELCSKLIYQPYQGKDSFCSSCLPGWDSWKVGGENNTSTLKFCGLGTLGCKCDGEQVVNLPYVSTRVEWTHHWKSKRSECRGSCQCTWKVRSLAWPPFHVILHQHRQQQKGEGSSWGSGLVGLSASHDIGIGFLSLEHFYLVREMLRWME